MRKTTWLSIIIVIGIIALAIYILSIKPPSADEQFAKCVGERATLYMKTGCFACIKQEELFGENYQYLTTINCVTDPQECTNNGILQTPTWVINNEKKIGYKTLEELSELTGCELENA